MSYEVLVQELRDAAGEYDGVASSLGVTPVVIDHVTPDSLGHIELAAWLMAVAEQCGNAHTALNDGLGALALGLRTSAIDYETTDDQVADFFVDPFSGPSSSDSLWPYGPPMPAPGSAEPPLHGPPVPGAGER